MYAREIQGRDYTFDFGQGLVKDNLLIVDRETSSVWSQLDGKAVSGPLTGTPLPVIPSMQTTWKFWRERHPDTRVMVVQDVEGNPYIYRNRKPGSPRPKEKPTEHNLALLGYGLVINGEAIYFPFSELDKATTPIEMKLGDEPITLHYNKNALTAWATDENGDLLTGVIVYDFGWMEFFSDSKVFRAE